MSFKQPEYCSVLGVHVTVGDMDSIKKCVLDNIEELRGKYICVSNVHTTVTAYENRNYRRVQNGAAMVFPDGGPLSIVCRLRGYKNASRVTGPDFMGEIFKEKGVRQFFYGSTPEASRNIGKGTS
jgi:N-acetylglucosaminyldiphosphoundecaprenol N-acetyl-beta-D-mannosaminyltransferase